MKRIMTVLFAAMILMTNVVTAGIKDISDARDISDASPQTHVIEGIMRIGLVTYFENKDELHLYNNAVVPGFFRDNSFYPETSIPTDGKDFWFSPATKYYLESEQTFDTYNEALEKVAPLREGGYKAYATLIDIGVWKVFAGHKSNQNELNQLKAEIDGLNDVTYYQAPDSYERVIMESASNYPVMFENRNGRTVFGTPDLRGDVPVLDMGKRSYRGYIEIGRYGRNDLTAVNVISLDDYLYSVVVSEVYAAWPEETLKAQAVAARTFAIYYKDVARKYPNDPFDLDDTISSQVYKGYSIEDDRVNAAVDATSGVMVYYDGTVVPTYFFAASGGRTENSENVWSGTVPYLKSVPDIYETEPERRPWTLELTPSKIESVLNRNGVDIGNIQDIEAEGYSDAGRVMNLNIIGTRGNYVLKKENMRYWLGINSRKFVIIKRNFEPEYYRAVVSADDSDATVNYGNAHVVSADGTTSRLLDGLDQVIVTGAENIINQPMISGKSGTFILAGEGWGHGVGMSQAGAKGMAKAGFTYEEILTHYYTGVEVR